MRCGYISSVSQAEQRTYTCINTILFCAGMSALITAATYLELDLQTLTLDEVEEEVGVAASSLLVLSEENLVVSHTELFHDTTYSQLVRLLLNFICSQVGWSWGICPVLIIMMIRSPWSGSSPSYFSRANISTS